MRPRATDADGEARATAPHIALVNCDIFLEDVLEALQSFVFLDRAAIMLQDMVTHLHCINGITDPPMSNYDAFICLSK